MVRARQRLERDCDHEPEHQPPRHRPALLGLPARQGKRLPGRLPAKGAGGPATGQRRGPWLGHRGRAAPADGRGARNEGHLLPLGSHDRRGRCARADTDADASPSPTSPGSVPPTYLPPPTVPPTYLPPVPDTGVAPTDPSNLFPTVSPSPTPSSTGSAPSARTGTAHRHIRTASASALLPFDSRLIGGQLLGLAALASAIVLAVARLSLRTRKPDNADKES